MCFYPSGRSSGRSLCKGVETLLADLRHLEAVNQLDSDKQRGSAQRSTPPSYATKVSS